MGRLREGGLMAKTGGNSGEKRSNRIIGRRFRYTADYKTVPSLDSGGRKVNDLVYVGKWILPVNGEEEFRRIVAVMRAALAAAVIAVIAAVLVHPAEMTHRWYLPVLLVALFPLAYEIMGAVMLPKEPKHMERVKFDKSFVRCGNGALVGLIVVGLAALGFAAYWVVASCTELEGASAFTVRDGLFAGLAVVAAAAELAVYTAFRKVRTETVENSAYRPE